MKGNIKEIDSHVRSTGFGHALESKVQRIIDQANASTTQDALTDLVIQKMSLILDHIQHLRMGNQAMRLELLRQECRLGTRLKQLDRPEHLHLDRQTTHDLDHARQSIRIQLDRIDSECRALTLSRDAKIRPLQHDLLQLLQRHHHLSQNLPPAPGTPGNFREHDSGGEHHGS